MQENYCHRQHLFLIRIGLFRIIVEYINENLHPKIYAHGHARTTMYIEYTYLYILLYYIILARFAAVHVHTNYVYIHTHTYNIYIHYTFAIKW